MNFPSVVNGVWWTLAEFLMKFDILCAYFGTVGRPNIECQCQSVHINVQNSSKILFSLPNGRQNIVILNTNRISESV